MDMEQEIESSRAEPTSAVSPLPALFQNKDKLLNQVQDKIIEGMDDLIIVEEEDHESYAYFRTRLQEYDVKHFFIDLDYSLEFDENIIGRNC